MLAIALHRHHAAHAQALARGAVLQPTHWLLGAVGLNHGEMRTGLVVAMLAGLLDAQPRRGWRGVELKLLDAIAAVECGKTGGKPRGQGLAVAAGQQVLHLRHARHQRSHALGGAAFGGDAAAQRLQMGIERAAFGRLHQARQIGQVGKRQCCADPTDGNAHHHHDLGPQPKFLKHLHPPCAHGGLRCYANSARL